MTRLAILTVDDDIWALAAWTKTIPALKAAGHDVAGLWLCPDRLGAYEGHDIYHWYKAAFGTYDFFRLGLFSLFARFAQFLSLKPLSLESLCHRYKIFFSRTPSVNEHDFAAWVRHEKIDILLLMTAEIIRRPLIGAVGKYIINRHDGLLPSNRGLFPNLWALIKEERQGITFHVVTEKIDEGRILYQEEIYDPAIFSSLTGFAIESFGNYHRRILKALGEVGAPSLNVLPSYQSLPDAADFQKFRNRGGAVIRWRDFLMILNLL